MPRYGMYRRVNSDLTDNCPVDNISFSEGLLWAYPFEHFTHLFVHEIDRL